METQKQKTNQAKERLQFGQKHFEEPLIMIIVAISKASTNSQFLKHRFFAGSFMKTVGSLMFLK